MGIVFGLCCLLLSPIALFTYGLVKHLHLLHDELTSAATDVIIPTPDSRK